jgi:hypothetical protein
MAGAEVFFGHRQKVTIITYSCTDFDLIIEGITQIELIFLP